MQCVFVLGFTPSTSLLRTPLGLAPMLSYVYLAFHSSRAHHGTTSDLYLHSLTSYTATMALQYLDSALLSRWTYAAQGPTSGLGGQKCLRRETDGDGENAHRAPTTFTSRLRFGWEEAFRARSPASPWQVKNVPWFDLSHPEALPTKARFVRTAALRCVVSLFIVDALGWMGGDASMNAVHFAPRRVSVLARWRDVTGEELALRVVSSLLHWVTFLCMMQALYDGVTVVVVGLLGWGRVERWPPLFNRWGECWSVRRFWGSFWHQFTRQKFLSPAYLLTFSLLRLRPGTFPAGYTLLTLTFCVSGAYHQFGDAARGVPWREAGAARFFATQAAGIMFEDAVQGAFRWTNGQQRRRTTKKEDEDRPAQGWKAVVGACWVLVWLVWTTPAWVYPVARRSQVGAILPFSVLR
ncbi:MAG: hypothetical protein Q9173_007343 [Seirophora scorigena]